MATDMYKARTGSKLKLTGAFILEKKLSMRTLLRKHWVILQGNFVRFEQSLGVVL